MEAGEGFIWRQEELVLCCSAVLILWASGRVENKCRPGWRVCDFFTSRPGFRTLHLHYLGLKCGGERSSCVPQFGIQFCTAQINKFATRVSEGESCYYDNNTKTKNNRRNNTREPQSERNARGICI